MSLNTVAPLERPVPPSFVELLSRVAERLLAADDVRQGAADLFEAIRTELSLDVYLNYILAEDGHLELMSAFGLSSSAERQGARLTQEGSVCGQVASTRNAHHATNIQASDDPNVSFLKAAGLNCYACTPMVARGRLLGTLGFGRRMGERFAPDELHLFHTVTHYLAMAYERLRTEDALRVSERRLNAVLDNASVAIFLMDERQHCAYMNAAAERLTGYRFEETLGRPLHDVIHHTRPDGSHFPLHECAIDRAFPENNNQTGEEVFVHKDGHFYDVAFTASPIRDETAKTVGTIIEVRDVTEEKRDQRARELLMREVDHRARNALFVVQSMLELTRTEDLSSYRESAIGRIGALARAQDNLARRNWQGGPLRDVVEGGIAAVAEPSSYRLEGPNSLLAADHVQPLSVIVHELATNARKYGALSRPEGVVSIQWGAGAEGDELLWREDGGTRIAEPTRQGFGSKLVRQLAQQLRGAAAYEWAPEGLRVRITAPKGTFTG